VPRRFSPFAIYLTGLGSWFVPLGIQQVLFAWLAAIVLHMDAFAVGIAQVALMAPSILFLPLGGMVADRGDARRLLLRYHVLYAVPPLVLAGVLSMGGLSYPLLIAYGLAAGSIGAFAVPTRDALLPAVAGGNLPRAVALATALQFFGQLLGIAAASEADRIGALPLLVEVKSALPDAHTFRVQREGVCRGEFDFLWQSRSIHLCDRSEERAIVPTSAPGQLMLPRNVLPMLAALNDGEKDTMLQVFTTFPGATIIAPPA